MRDHDFGSEDHDDDRHVTAGELEHRLREITHRFDERIAAMATQADIDAITTQVDTVEQHVTGAQTAIQAELDALQQQIAAGAQASALDLSGLQSAVAQLDPAVQALGELKPTAPAPSPAPSPAPAPAPAAPGDPSAPPATPADPTQSAPTDTPPAPAPAPPDQPAPAGQPSAAQPTGPVYTFAGDTSLIDQSAWPTSGFETDEPTPRPLYYFSGDTAGGPANGNGLSGGQWEAYTGPVKAAA